MKRLFCVILSMVLIFSMILMTTSVSFAVDAADGSDSAKGMLDYLISQGYPLMANGQTFSLTRLHDDTIGLRLLFDKDIGSLHGIYSAEYADLDLDGTEELVAVVGEKNERDSGDGFMVNRLVFRIAVVDTDASGKTNGNDGAYCCRFLDNAIYSTGEYLYEDEGNARSFVALSGRYVVALDRFDYESHVAHYSAYEYSGAGQSGSPSQEVFSKVTGFDVELNFIFREDTLDAEECQKLLGQTEDIGDKLFPVDSSTGRVFDDDVFRAQAMFFWYGECPDGATKIIHMTDNTSAFEKYGGTDKAFLTGDVNGDRTVTADDAMLALRGSARLEKLNAAQLSAADVNKDGALHADDARKILRHSAGLSDDAGIDWAD